MLGLTVALALLGVLGALVCTRVVQQGAAGDIGPNGVSGIRTRATRSSPEAWAAAHRAALPWTRAGGWAGAVVSAAGVVLAVAGGPFTAAAALSLSGTVVLALLVGVAGVVADRTARRVLGR